MERVVERRRAAQESRNRDLDRSWEGLATHTILARSLERKR